MVITLESDAPAEDIFRVVNILNDQRLNTQIVRLSDRTAIVTQDWIEDVHDYSFVLRLPSVRDVVAVDDPFKLGSRQSKPESSVIQVGPIVIGNGQTVVIAGPATVESSTQILLSARAAARAGAAVLRGGVFEPSTSPYEFPRLGLAGLRLLRKAGDETGLPILTEILSVEDIPQVLPYVDLLEVGAQNMQNVGLLRRLAQVEKPILLKRSPASTVTEWLLAAEYLLLGGNSTVILCDSGIRNFADEGRHSLDINGIALVKQLSHLPVIVDLSHATARRELVPAVSKAALAAGADGLMIEIHPEPERSLSESGQSLDLHQFADLMQELRSPLEFHIATSSSVAIVP